MKEPNRRSMAVHPGGARAKILLSSVFGPFAQDDAFGSRAVNPMELYQNQVTRVQGAFSLRMFHRSFGLMMIQANIQAPCTLLDFPTLEEFDETLRNNEYDVVGIGGIAPNVGKIKEMCRRVRMHQPSAAIVVGGHITNRAGIEEELDADHIVRGDGIAWFRRYLGEKTDAPVNHPRVLSAFGSRILGISLKDSPPNTAAILIPSVGCPMGCNFCSTSALFGGKGNFVNFYETGDELFSVMAGIEKDMGVSSFFVLDENFLLHRKRALRLLELMQSHGKSWRLSVFSSARVLNSYSMEQIVGLGIVWVWMGIEGKNSRYAKLNGIDTHGLVVRLQAHGIRVLGSSIIGMEDHTPENMGEVIDHAVSHATDFHQFMLYTPNPGTPLYDAHQKAGTLLDESEVPPADAHGQFRFNYRHPHISNGEETAFLLKAFRTDFLENGPSLARLVRTLLTGWLRYKHHPDPRILANYTRDAAPLGHTYAGAVWAMRRYFRRDRRMFDKMDRLLQDLYGEFGWRTRLLAPAVGLFTYTCIVREERRLARGWHYEPRSFLEKNAAAVRAEKAGSQTRSTELPRTGEALGRAVPAGNVS